MGDVGPERQSTACLEAIPEGRVGVDEIESAVAGVGPWGTFHSPMKAALAATTILPRSHERRATR